MNHSASITSSPASPRKWLSYIAIAIAALFAIGAATTGLAHWLLSASALDSGIVAQVRNSTGFAATINGQTHFHIFPQPRVDIEDVSFSNSAGKVRIHTAAFSAYLRILPFLAGRIEVARATLYQPDIRVAADRPHSEPAGGTVARASKSGQANAPFVGPFLGRVNIVDGHIRIETPNAQAAELNAINVDIDWPSALASAAITGEFAVRGTPIGVQAWLAQPMQLLRGGPSATILRLQSGILTLSTSGRITVAPRIQYLGRMSASAGSLRKLAEIADYPFPRHGAFDDLEMQGDVDWEGGGVALSNLHISLDGNDYEGSLAVEDRGGLPRFSGTLASDLLDLTPFFAGSPEPSDVTGLWNQSALDLSDLRSADLDLRVSASRLRLYDMEVQNAALSLVTRPGLFDLALAEATSNRGTVEGRVSLEAKGKTFAFHVNGTGANIDMSPMLIGGRHVASGTLHASLALDGTGADLPHIVQGLAGRADISIADGTISGTDLAAAVQAGGSKSPGEPIAALPGTTAFSNIAFGLQLANGVGQIRQGKFSAPGLVLDFAGNADFAHRILDLAATGRLTQSTRRQSQLQPLSLRLKGSFDAPRLIQGEANLRLPAPPPHSDDLPLDPTTDPE